MSSFYSDPKFLKMNLKKLCLEKLYFFSKDSYKKSKEFLNSDDIEIKNESLILAKVHLL